MGKRKNRKKKTLSNSVDVQDYLKLPLHNGKHPEDGQNLQIKAETKSSGHNEKPWNTSEGEVLSSSVLMENSTESEFAQDVNSSDLKGNVQEDCETKLAKDCFFATETSSYPRGWGKSAPVIQSVEGEGTSLEKDQQMTKLSVARNLGNMINDMEKDDPQVSICLNSPRVKPFVIKNLNDDVRSDSFVQIPQKKPSSYAEIKAETKSSGHSEKSWNTSEVEVLSSSVLMENSIKSEFARDVDNSDQKRNIWEGCGTELAEDRFFATKTSSPPRGWGKSAPVIQSVEGEGTSLVKGQQMTKLSVARDLGNMTNDMEKDDPQVRICLNDPSVKPFVMKNLNSDVQSDSFVQTLQKKPSSYASLERSQIFKTEHDSLVQSQTKWANYSHGAESNTFCASNQSRSSEISAIAEMSGTHEREIARRGIVPEWHVDKNKENSRESFRTSQVVTKYITPVQCKAEKRFPSNSFVHDVVEEPPDGNSVYNHQFRKYYGKSHVPPKSANKNFKWSHSMYASATTGNPTGNLKKHFQDALSKWLPIRNESIEKLQKLLDNALKNDAFYDNIQLKCKYGSVMCKHEKIAAPTSAWEFASSVGSMFCDMAGGLTSMVHMFSTDGIQSELQQVMDTDAAATKKMHEVRSRYVTEYHYTDEIIRKFGGTTMGETLGKISEAVGITEFFQQMKKANDNREDIVLAATSALSSIINRNCNRDVGRKVLDAVQELVDSNPACVGTVAGIGKSLYGAADLRMIPVKRAGEVGALVRAGTLAMDLALIQQEQSDILKLEQKMRSGSQSTMGKQIQEALDIFIEERQEMLELLSIIRESQFHYELLENLDDIVNALATVYFIFFLLSFLFF